MASYTIAIHDILSEHAEDLSLRDVTNIYNLGASYVFGPALNVVNADYRVTFVVGFVLHYMWDEIGQNNLSAFQLSLMEKLFNNKDYIDLIFENLDKQIYDTYKVHITDANGQKNKTGSKIEDGTDLNTKNLTDTTTRNSTDQNRTTLNTQEAVSGNVRDTLSGTDTSTTTTDIDTSSSGSDSLSRTGTDTLAKSGSDVISTEANNTTTQTGQTTTENSTTDSVTGQITDTLGATNTQTNNLTTELQRTGSNTNLTAHNTTNTTTSTDDSTQTFDNVRDVSTNNLVYTDAQSTTGSISDTTSFNDRERETNEWDATRTRSVSQLADTPQNGLTGSDVIGSSSGSIMGNISGSGSEYLTQATITDFESAGENHPKHSSITDSGSETNQRTFNNYGVSTTHTPDANRNTVTNVRSGSISSDSDSENISQLTGTETQTLTNNTTDTQTNIGTITSADTGTNRRTSSTTDNTQSESEVNSSINGSDVIDQTTTTEYGSSSVDTKALLDTSTYGKIISEDGTVTNEVEYGKVNRKDLDTSTAQTGTVTDVLTRSGSDALTHTGTDTLKTDKETTTTDTESDNKHINEEEITMSYETLIASTSLLNKVWELFDPLFIQIYG